MDDEEERRRGAFRRLGQLIDGVLAQECERHYDARTQEHQLTAKIASAIEREVGGVKIDGYRVGVAIQDIPEKGRGTLESKIGADLYVSVVLQEDGEDISKGMLVQGKWDDTFVPEQMTGQIDKMMSCTKTAAHVWIYNRAGVTSIPAADIARGRVDRNRTTPGQLIADGLECTEGDLDIGRDTTKKLVPSLNAILRELEMKSALAVTVRKRQARRRR